MPQDHRPAPVITIIDPSCPAPLVDVLGSGPARPPWRPSTAQLLVLVVALLLGTAGTTIAVQRDRSARAASTAQTALGKVRFHHGLSGALRRPDVLDYLFVLVGPDPRAVRVRSIAVGGEGWQGRTDVDNPVLPRGRNVVALSHALDCGSRIATQPTAVVTVMAGAQRRRVPLQLAPDFLSTVDAFRRQACGEVGADSAVQVATSSARRAGDSIVIDLGLTNTSVHPVRVTGLLAEGLGLQTGPLPLLLPGRSPGLVTAVGFRRLGDLPGTRIRVVLRVLECLGVGQVFKGFGEAPTLDLMVDGVGGASARSAPVDGLAQLEKSLVRDRCRR